MTNTEHLHLHLPEPSDPVTPAPLNANFTALDTALATLTAALGTHGHNCRVAIGSYVGDGTIGAEHPMRLELGFTPVLVIITDGNAANQYYPVYLVRPLVHYRVGNGNTQVTWGDNSVEWYSEASIPSYQSNYEDVTYYYIVIGFET